MVGYDAVGDDLCGEVVRMVVDRVPDPAVLLGTLLHFLADESIEDVNLPVKVRDGVVVPRALGLLSLQRIFYAAPALPLTH